MDNRHIPISRREKQKVLYQSIAESLLFDILDSPSRRTLGKRPTAKTMPFYDELAIHPNVALEQLDWMEIE